MSQQSEIERDERLLSPGSFHHQRKSQLLNIPVLKDGSKLPIDQIEPSIVRIILKSHAIMGLP
jgi:hypothetical protein